MRIDVTAADIAAGERCRIRGCPVALAVRRADGRRWEVYGDGLVFGLTAAELPEAAREFVARFDGGELVAPFGFDCDLPAPEPRAVFLLVNKVGGKHGEILSDECLNADGTRGVKNVRHQEPHP
jgi:hypothetical protein